MMNRMMLLLLAVVVIFGACDADKPEEEIIAGTQVTGIPSIDKLLKEVEKSPNDASLFYRLGEAYYENEGYDEAIMAAQKAISLDSTQPKYFNLLAYTYLNYNQSYEALLTMQRASGYFPDSMNTLINLAEIQMTLANYDASMQTAKRILEVYPASDEAFYIIGMNMKYKGDTSNALKSLQTAVERNEDHLLAYQELAMLSDALGKDNLALLYFDNSLRIDSTDKFTLFNRGNFHRDRRQDSEAVYWYRKAFMADKDFAEPYFNIGILYLEHDSLKQAYEHFNLAVNVEPTFDIAYYYRGITSEKMGDKTAAISDYRNALKFDPDLGRAKKALKDLGQEVDNF
ncbi:MAG: tetratricopeptide repeat protein [Saprospiraceae bacterium]